VVVQIRLHRQPVLELDLYVAVLAEALHTQDAIACDGTVRQVAVLRRVYARTTNDQNESSFDDCPAAAAAVAVASPSGGIVLQGSACKDVRPLVHHIVDSVGEYDAAAAKCNVVVRVESKRLRKH